MNVSFTKKQENYISDQIESGDFQNASEVVRDALRLHEVYRHRIIQDLRHEIEKGWDGNSSSRSIKDIIKSKKKDNSNV
jgi:antitoxin ParD1/3/4